MHYSTCLPFLDLLPLSPTLSRPLVFPCAPAGTTLLPPLCLTRALHCVGMALAGGCNLLDGVRVFGCVFPQIFKEASNREEVLERSLLVTAVGVLVVARERLGGCEDVRECLLCLDVV